MKRVALYATPYDDSIKCTLCPHRCVIPSGKRGLCGVRENDDGTLYAESYSRVTSMSLDPIEKKPLRRFQPGSFILSVGSYGCNLRCGFCQNHGISMREAPYSEHLPEDIAKISLELEKKGNIGVAYTYNEPLIGYEFVLDCAKLIKKQGQKNVLVTNGYIEQEPLVALLNYIDAMNIDLKAFSDDFYRKVGGSLPVVKNAIITASKNCHVEITTLVIPGENDSDKEMEQLAEWLASVDPKTPLHISRFFPNYKYSNIEPTPIDTLRMLYDIARRYLEYVYIGNV